MKFRTHPARAFFGRRKGHKLRPRQAQLIDTLLPRLAIDLARAGAGRTWRAVSGAGRPKFALEIGFGGGEAMIAQAQAAARTPALSASSLSSTAWPRRWPPSKTTSLRNIRLHFDDAVNLIAWLPDMSLARIDLIHPDPWPKRRHWKRRFVQDEMVARLARILRRGGEFRFVTDIADYAAWTLQHLLRSKRLRMDGAMRRRLAQAVAGLHRDALSRQGGARGTRVVFPDLPKTLKRSRAIKRSAATCQKRTTRCAVEAESRP